MTCEVCGYRPLVALVALERHHIRPRAEGGSNKAENLVTLCANCHRCAHYLFAGQRIQPVRRDRATFIADLRSFYQCPEMWAQTVTRRCRDGVKRKRAKPVLSRIIKDYVKLPSKRQVVDDPCLTCPNDTEGSRYSCPDWPDCGKLRHQVTGSGMLADGR